MNAARIARLFRERARIDAEIADAFDEESARVENDASAEDGIIPQPPPKSKPRRRKPHVRIVPPPLHEPGPVDVARASKLLRRHGLR